jgi:hypothetical protein
MESDNIRLVPNDGTVFNYNQVFNRNPGLLMELQGENRAILRVKPGLTRQGIVKTDG